MINYRKHRLPIEWRKCNLSDAVDFLDNKRIPLKEEDRKTRKGPYPYYGASGIIDYIDDYIFDEDLILLAEDGANILNRATPIAFKATGKYWVNNHAHVLRPKINADINYLTYYLESLSYIQFNSGAAQPKLNHEVCSTIPVVLPSICEQKAIADLLSTWDEAIERTERLIQAKERRFQWLLRRTMTDTAKGIVKEGWKRIAIGSLLTESRIPDMTNDPHKRLTVRLHLRGVEAREVRGTEASDATAYFVRKADQLIYGKQNIFKGAVGIVPPELDGYASTQDIPAFDIDKTVDPGWLLFLFSCPGFYKKLEIYASGSGSKRLHPKDLFKISVSVPSLEEQKSFAERLYIARKEINLLEQLAERYKTQKRGLMQKLLTGQWRIKFEKEVA